MLRGPHSLKVCPSGDGSQPRNYYEVHADAVYMQGELTTQRADIVTFGAWPVIKNIKHIAKAARTTEAQYRADDLSKWSSK
jgi:hypothetical protein